MLDTNVILGRGGGDAMMPPCLCLTVHYGLKSQLFPSRGHVIAVRVATPPSLRVVPGQ
jgi:hypothetical protein